MAFLFSRDQRLGPLLDEDSVGHGSAVLDLLRRLFGRLRYAGHVKGPRKDDENVLVSGIIKAIAPENLDAPWLVYDRSHSNKDQSPRATHEFVGLIATGFLDGPGNCTRRRMKLGTPTTV